MNDSIAIDVPDVRRVGAVLRFLRTCFHRFALTLGYVVLTILTFVVFESACLWIGSPERRDCSRVLAHFSSDFELPPFGDQVADFDGDGVPDELYADWHRVETLLGSGTSGMVYVKSGDGGDILLARAKLAPILSGGWYDDYDGDGLTDVVMRRGDGWIVCGFDRGER